MSRKNKQNKLFLYLLLLLFIGYLFIRFGLRLFVDIAFYLTQGNAKLPSAQNANSKISIITEPVIENPPTATNEAVLILRGKADPDTSVQMYQNGVKINSLSADFEGGFEFEVVLEPNSNEFYVKSIDEYNKKTRKSKVYQILYLEKEPMLEITSLEDNKKYYEADISVEGKTDKEVFIQVNNMPVVIKADGSFAYPYTLKPGENNIRIEAEDMAGNSTVKEVKVIYIE